jgi:hypothetical protein
MCRQFSTNFQENVFCQYLLMWSSTRGKSVALVSAIGWESHAMVYLWEAKPFEVCGSLDTVYQKQEELNQRKRVLPVLNNELKGV